MNTVYKVYTRRMQCYKRVNGEISYTCFTHVVKHLPVIHREVSMVFFVQSVTQCPLVSVNPHLYPQFRRNVQKKSRDMNYRHTGVISETFLPNNVHCGIMVDRFWRLTLIVKYTALWRGNFLYNCSCDHGRNWGRVRGAEATCAAHNGAQRPWSGHGV
jgi:hypothetical protein